jgi:Zn-dependent protease
MSGSIPERVAGLAFTVARPWGVPVRVHGSLALLALPALAWGAREAGWAGAAVVGVFTLGVMVSLVAHELGHVGMGRRYGLTTREVWLTPMGGVARMGLHRVSAAVDLRVAAAGPAVSLLLSALCWAVASLLWVGSARAVWEAWGLLNLGLGAFNLLPVWPLDGGRILRDVLSRWFGMRGAARITLAVALVLTACMAAVGWRAGQVGLLAVSLMLALLQRRAGRVLAAGGVV